MKKVLLIGFVIFCIFQMMVMATAIDIGNEATDRPYLSASGVTYVDTINSANATGKITSVEIWAENQMAGVEVAIFYVVSGNNLSTRDYETVDNGNGAGVVLAGSKQTFTVDLDVEAGDHIGFYCSGGNISRNDGGNAWSKSGDGIPCTDVTFAVTANRTYFSLYGTGATASAFALVKFNNVTITKWNEVAITKWNNKNIP